VPRLSIATLPARFAEGVSGPAVDPTALSIGIVHFGVGAFHRSHQAVFTEDAAAATGDTRWGILGVTGRTENVVHQLRPQDGLYGVLQKGVGETSLRIIGSLRDVAWPGRDSVRVIEAMASPTTHIASLTITEKGYLRAPDGGIDLALPAVAHDLALIGSELRGEAAAESSHTAIGLLVRGLARRYRLGGAPFTVLSCDNVVHNGVMVKQVVLSLARATGDSTSGWLEWLEQSVAYPSTMVDRITPAATPADHAEAFALLGLTDEALVVAEPFSQWVVEDRFAGPRPAWEKAGVILTGDVDPFERAKLRILNGTHSLLAYVGVLGGFETIAGAVNDPALRNTVRRILDDDILPTLETPTGFDLTQYRDEVLDRFANPALAHTTRQVAMDGSQKLPNRILGTAVDRLAAGELPTGLAFVVAAWILFIASTLEPGGPALDDPLADRLQAAVGSPEALEAEPAAVVERIFALRDIFPLPLRESVAFEAAVVSQLPAVRSLVAAPHLSNG
jgi:fructuronate reductase